MTIFFIVGRILFGGYFLYSGYKHLANGKSYAGYAKSKNVPMPEIAVPVTGIMLVLGGAGVILGIAPTLSIALLLIFMIPTTLMMHQFWMIKDMGMRMGEHVNFMKNLAIIGALLMMLALPQPWMSSFY